MFDRNLKFPKKYIYFFRDIEEVMEMLRTYEEHIGTFLIKNPEFEAEYQITVNNKFETEEYAFILNIWIKSS